MYNISIPFSSDKREREINKFRQEGIGSRAEKRQNPIKLDWQVEKKEDEAEIDQKRIELTGKKNDQNVERITRERNIILKNIISETNQQ